VSNPTACAASRRKGEAPIDREGTPEDASRNFPECNRQSAGAHWIQTRHPFNPPAVALWPPCPTGDRGQKHNALLGKERLPPRSTPPSHASIWCGRPRALRAAAAARMSRLRNPANRRLQAVLLCFSMPMALLGLLPVVPPEPCSPVAHEPAASIPSSDPPRPQTWFSGSAFPLPVLPGSMSSITKSLSPSGVRFRHANENRCLPQPAACILHGQRGISSRCPSLF